MNYPSWSGMEGSHHSAEPAPWRCGCAHANATAESARVKARPSCPLRVSVQGLWLPSCCASSSCWVSWDRSLGGSGRKAMPRGKYPAANGRGSIEEYEKMAGRDRKKDIRTLLEFRWGQWDFCKCTGKRAEKCKRDETVSTSKFNCNLLIQVNYLCHYSHWHISNVTCRE